MSVQMVFTFLSPEKKLRSIRRDTMKILKYINIGFVLSAIVLLLLSIGVNEKMMALKAENEMMKIQIEQNERIINAKSLEEQIVQNEKIHNMRIYAHAFIWGELND